MSLIKCSKCGKEISDIFKKCIFCGNPIKKDIIKAAKDKLNKKTIIIIGVSIILVISIIIATCISLNNQKKMHEAKYIAEFSKTIEI